MKKYLITGLITLLIIAGGIFIYSNKKTGSSSTTSLPTSYEYFWGEGCSHCANVEKFLEGWSGKDKVALDKKEVFYNRANSQLMQQRAAYCNLDTRKIGVPFLFTPEGKCLVGDEPIIQYLKSL